MYRSLSVIAIVPVFNEAAKIGEVVARIPRQIIDEILIVDDGSTDDPPGSVAALVRPAKSR
jgi:glycosyltransferase involved in cell wall biosynthesis